MPRAARPELLLAGALALTLALKAQVAAHVPHRDDARMVAELAAALRGHGYATRVVDRPGSFPLVVGQGGGCTVAARAIRAASGEFDRNDLLVLGQFGPVQELYAGTYYPPGPRPMAMAAARLQRELDRIGIAVPIMPVISLAAPPGCRPPPGWFAGLRVHMTR